MTNENLLDQTICKLPFEVVAIYDNCSQLLQENTNTPPSINVKIIIRNKEDAETGRFGTISVSKRNVKNCPKRMRLGHAQSIMSFNLALEPNSDESKKKSNRKLFQTFKPGACLSSHKDKDGYSYMPSTSNELKRRSTSGIEDYRGGQITGTFALKKNDFSSSYTNVLKTPKTFLGKCKPGGCLDPPFGEDKYAYNSTVNDAETLQPPIINRNSLDPDINAIDIKPKTATQNQQLNVLHQSHPETDVLGNIATLVTYPTTLSSSKLKTKDSKNRKSSLRMQGEQIELSRNLTNEFPEAYFIPPKKEKPKYDKNYNYDEKEPKVKEAYVNKDYIMQSQTPSELLSDTLTITSKSFVEPLRKVINEKQVIRELNPKTLHLMKSKDFLYDKVSKDKIKINSTSVSVESLVIDEKTFPQKQSISYHNNIPTVENIFSIVTESKSRLYKDTSKLNSTIKENVNQETREDINYEKNYDPNNNLDSKDKHSSLLYTSNFNNEISTKTSKKLSDQSNISLNNVKSRESNKVLGQHSNDFNNEINKIEDKKQQIGVRSEEDKIINPVKDEKSDIMEHEYIKKISGQIISKAQIRDDDKSKNFDMNLNDHGKNISDLKLTGNGNTEELIEVKTERTSEHVHSLVVSDLSIKVSSLNSLDDTSQKKSHNIQISPKNINVKPKDSLFGIVSSTSTRLSNEINNEDKSNEKPNQSRTNTLQNTLLTSLTGYTSTPKTEINSINAVLNKTSQEKNIEITSMHDKIGSDTILIPETVQLNSLSQNKIELENDNRWKLQGALSITSQMKATKDTAESTDSISHLNQNFTDFDPLKNRQSLNYTSKNATANFNPVINDSEMVLSNQKTPLNISNEDILSDNKFQKTNNIGPFQSLSNIIYNKGSEKDINKLENKESVLSQAFDITFLPEKFELQESDLSIEEKQKKIVSHNKSKSGEEESEKETYQKKINIKKLKTIDPAPEIIKSIEDSHKDINTISSIAINFGFHTFANKKTGFKSIDTFDPSINTPCYPQDKIVTINTILRKKDNEIGIQIDSETDLRMQIKNSRPVDDNKEILRNKDKLLEQTLKAVYTTLMLIEKNIIKLKEETDSLCHEQLLVKEALSKEVTTSRISPTIRTCNCLQREIGLK